MRAEFAVSAGGPEQFPKDGLPEYAFLGRSNVGKSSLINALVGQRELAFTSSQPGRTATINFYRVDGAFYLVDLPGYGYARVSHETSEGWKELVERYLLGRATLERSVLVMDARRGWMEPDLRLKRWLEFHRHAYVVVATKVDKLKNQSKQHGCLASFRKEGAEPLLFSAPTGRGVRELWQAILKTPHNP